MRINNGGIVFGKEGEEKFYLNDDKIAEELIYAACDTSILAEAGSNNVLISIDEDGKLVLKELSSSGQVYSKDEVDQKIANAGSGGTGDLSNYYTKTQVDGKLSYKADNSSVVKLDGSQKIKGEKHLVNNISYIGGVKTDEEDILGIPLIPIVNKPRQNLGAPSLFEMAFLDEEWVNRLNFYKPEKMNIYKSTDGSTWNLVTELPMPSDLDSKRPVSEEALLIMKKRLVGGDYISGSKYELNAGEYVAFEFEAYSYYFLETLYLYTSSKGRNFTLKIEAKKPDDTWEEIVPETDPVNGGWPGHMILRHKSIAFREGSENNYRKSVRIVIKDCGEKNLDTYPTSDICRIQWWGSYPYASRNIWQTDVDKNITFPGRVKASWPTDDTDLTNKKYVEERFITEMTEVQEKLDSKVDKVEEHTINHTFNTRITASDETGSKYEIPDGSVAYPQIIGGMSYKSKNLLDTSMAINEFTHRGVTFTKLGDGGFKVSGTNDGTGGSVFSPCTSNGLATRNITLPAGTYTVGMFEKINTNEILIQLFYHKSDGSTIYISGNNESNNTKTFTLDAEYVVGVYIQTYNTTETQTVTLDNTVYPFIVRGEAIPTEFEPYFEGIRNTSVTNIKSVGENLLDSSLALDTLEKKGFTSTKLNDGGFRIKGTSDTTGDATFPLNSETQYVEQNTLLSAGTYTFGFLGDLSLDSSSITITARWINESGAWTYATAWRKWPKTFTLPSDTMIGFYIIAKNNNTVDNTVYPYLVNGSTAPTEFKPYWEDQLNIPDEIQQLDGYGLGINDEYYNYIDYNRKVFVKKVARYAFTGNEVWKKEENVTVPFLHTNLTGFDALTTENSTAKYQLCNYFNSSDIGSTTNNKGIHYFISRIVRFRDDTLNTPELMQNFCKQKYDEGNPLVIMFPIEPIETNISEDLSEFSYKVDNLGTETLISEYGYAAPTTIRYNVSINEQVIENSDNIAKIKNSLNDYLPLSGGRIDGNLSVDGTLEAEEANISTLIIGPDFKFGNGTYTAMLPAKNGTIVFKDDLDSYLSLSGGTVNGDIGVKNIHFVSTDVGNNITDPEGRIIVRTIRDSNVIGNRQKTLGLYGSEERLEYKYGDDYTEQIAYTSDLDSKTNASVLPNNSGDIKTKYRTALRGYHNSATDYVYYKLCTLPINNDNNFASAIISGRIGGWSSDVVGYINALICNRGTPSISLINIGGNVTDMSKVWRRCDIVLYTNSDSSTTAYLKCLQYYIFDLNIELMQDTATLDYDGVKLTTTPEGTLVASASTTKQKLEVANGQLFIGDVSLDSMLDKKVDKVEEHTISDTFTTRTTASDSTGSKYEIQNGSVAYPQIIGGSVTAIESISTNIYKQTDSYDSTVSSNGVTITNNHDGSFTLNGTPTQSGSIYFDTKTTIEPGQYTFQMFVENASDYVLTKIASVFRNSSVGYGDVSYVNVYHNKPVYKEPTLAINQIYIWISNTDVSNGVTFDNVVYRPMITKGNYSSDKCMPYWKDTLNIPAEVQTLPGYGLYLDEHNYNYIDFNRKLFIQNIEENQDGDLVALQTPVETDISEYLSEYSYKVDNLGTETIVTTTGSQAVPTVIKYNVSINEQVIENSDNISKIKHELETKANYSDIENIQADLNNKLTINSDSHNYPAKVYGVKPDGTQTLWNAQTSATAYTLVYRSSNGTVAVGTPTAETHATTKKYVDDGLSQYVYQQALEEGRIVAGAATKATQDGDGNIITSTYATKTEVDNAFKDCVNSLWINDDEPYTLYWSKDGEDNTISLPVPTTPKKTYIHNIVITGSNLSIAANHTTDYGAPITNLNILLNYLGTKNFTAPSMFMSCGGKLGNAFIYGLYVSGGQIVMLSSEGEQTISNASVVDNMWTIS